MEFSSLSQEEQTLYCCLALQHRLGYAGFARLLEVFGGPGEVYRAPPEALAAAYPKLHPDASASIRKGPDIRGWERAAARCDSLGVRVAPLGTGAYPVSLKGLFHPPPLLFIQGELRPSDARAVAVVGTRNPTEYGRRAAFVLARDLAGNGVTVVSGLAVGIDAEAHAGALEGRGRTLAVIGCGHDVDYPRENRALTRRLIANGAVLSEFPPGEPPQRVHFPRRNRILSALARATVVVEAGSKSGALITAAYALAQGKSLFAVPGPIFSAASRGTNDLLRRGICPATAAEDVLAGMETGSAPRRGLPGGRPDAAAGGTDPEIPRSEADPVLQLWRGEEICSLDRLEERVRGEGGGLAGLLAALLRLELRGLIQRLPGPAFRRTRLLGFAG